MASPRISLARVLELGVRVSWREAAVIVHEALAGAGPTEGAGPATVTAESCLLTRGGDVVLTGTATQARPEAVVRLLDDLLASCSNPGRFSGAVANGTALDMIEELSRDSTANRRRVEVASVAIRGLAAEADAAHVIAHAEEQRPSADFDDFIAAPSAIPTIPDQTFALGDSAFSDAEIRAPGLDHEDLNAAVEAAPTPAALPKDLPWPSVMAPAPPSAIPMLDDQTVARLGDSAVGNAEVRSPGLDEVASVTLRELVAAANAAGNAARAIRPSLDHEDLIAAVEAAREWTAPEDAVAAPAIGRSPAQGTRPSVTLPPASFPMDRPTPAPFDAPNRSARRLLVGMASAVAAAALIVAVGFASYWLVRDGSAEPGGSSRRSDASALDTAEPEPQAPVAYDAAAVPADPNPPVIAPAAATQPAWPLHFEVADGAFSPTFDTSGRELFFHAGRADVGRLLVASLDERGQVARISALINEPARNYHPRVSPDGRLLAFDSDRGGERSVYVSERDGSNPQLVSGNGYGAVPTWSPDMKWLAFVRGEPARPRVWNLWLRNLSSGALQRYTSYRSGQVWGASWFPDGQSICYSHEHQLVISRLDGLEDIVLDTPRAGHLVRTPAVSPDGRRVVFQVFNDGVWLLDVRTLRMHRILGDRTAEEFSWTPDGSHIAYHSRRGGAWRIWMLNVSL